MSDGFLRRHLITNGAVAVAILALAGWSASQGDRAGAVVLVLAVVLSGWWSWPTRGPHVDEAAARAEMGPDDVIVYWRPGCVHCARLAVASRLSSWPQGSPRRFRVNIWRDPDAATTVRLARGGFETVPTVLDADGELIEATPGGIKAQRHLGIPPT